MEARRSRFVPFLIVALSAILVHIQTLGFPFVFDDDWLVVRNAFLREPWSMLSAFAHHFWYGTPFGTGYYRPLVVAMLALNGHLLGWGPAGFHLVNVLLHAANAVLVLRLLRRLAVGTVPATIAALFFALHPASAWAVGSVVARVDLLPALFVLLAWLALEGSAAWATGLFFAAALLCKESAVAFLGVPIMGLRPVRDGAGDAAGRRRTTALASCLAGGAVVLAARLAAHVPLAPPVSGIDPLTNPLAGMAQPGRTCAALVLAGRYLLYLLLPASFRDPAGYGTASAPPSWHAPEVLLASAFLAAWAVLVAGLWIRRDRSSLFLGFSLLAFVPASNLLVPVGSLYAQNFLYLPLLGLSLAVGDLLGRLEGRRSPAAARAVAAVAAVALALLAGATFVETRIWREGTTLFASWTDRFPRYALGWSRLGVARLDHGDSAGAEPALREALRLEDRNAEGHYNLGVALLMTARGDQPDRVEEALRHSRRALELAPDLVQARVNASNALLLLDRPAEAETEARAALAADPDLAPARRNLGEALFRQGRYRDAIPVFRDLVSQSPHDPNLRSPLVVSLIDAGDLDDARVETETARREYPDLAWFDFCLARVEARSGHRDAAVELLRRARARDPQTAEWISRVGDFAGYPDTRVPVAATPPAEPERP